MLYRANRQVGDQVPSPNSPPRAKHAAGDVAKPADWFACSQRARVLVRGERLLVIMRDVAVQAAHHVVVIEFDTVEHAKAAHDSAAYQAALKVLEDGAERDIRLIEGV